MTTKAQVNGYRFLLRRLDHALIRRDVRMLHDPMRSQMRSLLVGAVLGIVVIAGAAILAFLRPQGSIDKADIVMGKESGALYVLVGDANGNRVLHPALNLASARLISGSNEAPTSVKDSKLASVPRGAMLGIPGAPAALPGSAQRGHSDWSLCETVQLSKSGSAAAATGVETTVIAATTRLDERVRRVAGNEAELVRRDDKTYLIYDGKRAEVDPSNAVMARVLGLTGQRARPANTGLLGALTPVPPLTAPEIPQAGQPGPGRLSDVPVGGVISVAAVGGADRPELYVVLADGVQRIGDFTAAVIRTANSQGMAQIKSVPPDVLGNVSVVRKLTVDHYPAVAPKLLTAEDAPVTCVAWSKPDPSGDGTVPNDQAAVTVLAGSELPLPDSARPVALATADASGDRVDKVYLAPSSGEFVQVTGIDPGSPRRDGLFYVADNGIRYGIPDVATAEVLGLGKPRHAPWAIVGQLVPGPTLSRPDALVAHDVLPTR
nr:type VII secretion protein EccB [Nocardia bovistercoris]